MLSKLYSYRSCLAWYITDYHGGVVTTLTFVFVEKLPAI